MKKKSDNQTRIPEQVTLVFDRKDLYMALEGFVIVGLFLLMWS